MYSLTSRSLCQFKFSYFQPMLYKYQQTHSDTFVTEGLKEEYTKRHNP